MLFFHCPNCQHDNTPGERFCASCGVPLNLKPCAVCGKVDRIEVMVCSGCGANFPPLTGVCHVDEPAVPTSTPAPAVTQPPSTMRAVPLIVVTLAAAGIPLLWLYQDQLLSSTAEPPQSIAIETRTVQPVPPAPPPAASPEPPVSASKAADSATAPACPETPGVVAPCGRKTDP